MDDLVGTLRPESQVTTAIIQWWAHPHDGGLPRIPKGLVPGLAFVTCLGLPAAAPESSTFKARGVGVAALGICESHAPPDHQEEGPVE